MTIFNKMLTTLLLSIFSFTSMAHVRWFVDQSQVQDLSFPVDGLMFIILSGGLLYIFSCYFLQHISKNIPKLNSSLNKPVELVHHTEWYFLIAIFNLMLIICLMKGEFLAPNLQLSPKLIMLGIFLQVIVLMVVPFSVGLTGFLVCLVGLLLPVLFAELAIDYIFEVIALGLALMCIAPKLSSIDNRFYKRYQLTHFSTYASRVLVVGLGLQLIALALRNKLFEPGAAMIFVEANPYYNFMPTLGFESFSHLHFVFAAGVFEMIFGLMLVLGWAVRYVGLALAVVFISTAVLTGLHELVGHLPIFAVLFIVFLKPQSMDLKVLNLKHPSPC